MQNSQILKELLCVGGCGGILDEINLKKLGLATIEKSFIQKNFIAKMCLEIFELAVRMKLFQSSRNPTFVFRWLL